MLLSLQHCHAFSYIRKARKRNICVYVNECIDPLLRQKALSFVLQMHQGGIWLNETEPHQRVIIKEGGGNMRQMPLYCT